MHKLTYSLKVDAALPSAATPQQAAQAIQALYDMGYMAGSFQVYDCVEGKYPIVIDFDIDSDLDAICEERRGKPVSGLEQMERALCDLFCTEALTSMSAYDGEEFQDILRSFLTALQADLRWFQRDHGVTLAEVAGMLRVDCQNYAGAMA